jgi:hypothetical protein
MPQLPSTRSAREIGAKEEKPQMTLGVRTERAKPRWLALLVIVGLMTGLTATAVFAAPPKITLDQCRNGSATDPNDCEALGGSAGWVNGNAGASNAHFVEGHSIPYRARLTDTPLGNNEVTLGYDIRHSGVHAIDFLTHYDRLQPHGQFDHPAEDVFPLSGVTMPAVFDTATCAIPKPSNLSTGAAASFDTIVGQGKDLFTVFGADSCTVTQGVALEGDITAAQSEARVVVTFNATSATVVMAWGGHIARTADWDDGGAAGISGSPYHMRLKAWSAGNVGNQDRSLSAAAVLSEASVTTTTLHETDSAGTDVSPANNGASITVTVGAYVKDVASIAPSDATGTAEFRYYSGATSAAAIAACAADTSPPTGGTLAGTGIAVSGGTADSTVVQFNSVGFFAWRVFFTGSGIYEDSTSACNEEILTVQQAATSLNTSPWIYPNDQAVISAAAGGNLAGSVKFKLYEATEGSTALANCQANGATGLIYDPAAIAVSGASPQTVNTANTTVKVSASKTVYWRVEYTSTNANQGSRISNCVENINVTLTGDSSGGTVPAAP